MKYLPLILLLLSACDATSVEPIDDPVEEPVEKPVGERIDAPAEAPVPLPRPCPGAGEGDDFFPLGKGHRWTFAYESYSRSMGGGRYREEGTLSWTIQDVACSDTLERYTLEEARWGIGGYYNSFTYSWDTVDVAESRTIMLEQDSLSHVMLPYGRVAIPRYHDGEADTVKADAGSLVNLFHGPVSGCSTHDSRVRLVRDTGLVYYDGGCMRVSHQLGLTMELESFERPDDSD